MWNENGNRLAWLPTLGRIPYIVHGLPGADPRDAQMRAPATAANPPAPSYMSRRRYSG